MAIEKVIDVKIQSEQAEGAVKSLKQQFREAQNEVNELSEKFGATSDEAIKAAKRASELKDAIGDAKSLTDAFNPDAKFKALSSSLAGVVGGFSAVQGAMGLVGVESDEVEKTLLKVQSAMALSQGLQSIGESVDSFKQLSAVIRTTTIFQKLSTAAQWLWNAAMSANPVGAVIVAIVALITAGYKLISWYQDSSEANETATKSIKANTKALENQSKQAQKGASNLQDYNKYQYDMAKASGASSEQLRKLALKHKDEEIALNQKNAILAQSTFLRERDTLASLKNSDASDEVIKAQEKLTQDTYKEFTKQRDSFYKSKEEKVALIRQQNVEIKTEQTNANKTAREKQQEANENAREKQKEAKEQRKKDFEETLKNEELSFEDRRKLVNKSTLFDAEEKKKLLKEIDKDEKEEKKKKDEKEKEELQRQKDALKAIEEKNANEIEDLKAKTDREKLEIQKQRDLEELDNIKLSEEEKQKARLEILEKYRIKGEELDAIEAEKKTQTDLEKKQKELEDQTLTFEERRAILDEQNAIITEGDFKTEEERTKAKDANVKARIELDKLEGKAKIDALDAVSQTLAGASELLGKETAAGKAMAIASATISTFLSAQKAYDATVGIPYVGPFLAPVNAGLAIASGIKNVKSILSVKVPGGGGGASAPSISSSATGGATSAPQFNVVGNAGTNQLASSLGNAMQQNPIQAYVVSGAVTTAQSLDRNIIQNASIG
jgi:hypothetical protein